jgi:hypothetical protein
MSIGEFIASLAANFIVAGIVWQLKGANAGLICLLIGFILLVVAYFLRKKPSPQSPPVPLQTQSNEQRVEVNPQQHIHISSDLLQVKPPPPARIQQPDPPSNIRFVEIKTVDGTFSRAIAHRLPLVIRETTPALLVCFRNEAIAGQTLKQPQVNAHIIFKGVNGEELTDLFHGAWADEREDYTTFQTGQKRCLVVAALSEERLLKIWKKEYHTDTSWMASGPLFEIQTEPIFGTIATIVIQLLEHWNGTCIREFLFEVEPAVKGTLLPNLRPKKESGQE